MTPGKSSGRSDGAAADKAMSPAQCRMARALLRWTQRDLARKAAVARRTISDFEAGVRPLRFRTRRDITETFLSAGVIFDENSGVRISEPDPARNGSAAASGVAATLRWSAARHGSTRP